MLFRSHDRSCTTIEGPLPSIYYALPQGVVVTRPPMLAFQDQMNSSLFEELTLLRLLFAVVVQVLSSVTLPLAASRLSASANSRLRPH